MNESLQIKRLTAGTVFKLLWIGNFVWIIAASAGCGIGAFFGAHDVLINGQAWIGMRGLIAALVMGVLLLTVGTAITWFFTFAGLWLFSLVRPIRITFISR
jgi:hypothetical protein